MQKCLGFAFLLMWSTHAMAHGRDHRCREQVVSRTQAGPANYHQTYANIRNTLVTLRDFDIRTEDGNVIHVDTNDMNVDLQQLAGFAQGLDLDLTNVSFPGGATEIRVAEIVTHVKGDGRIQSTDGTSCDLEKLPRTLNLYTAAAIPLGHDVYRVKVGFNALNAIQLDVVTLVTRTCCHRGTKEQSSVEKTCKLVNKRQPITTIPRAVDDNF